MLMRARVAHRVMVSASHYVDRVDESSFHLQCIYRPDSDDEEQKTPQQLSESAGAMFVDTMHNRVDLLVSIMRFRSIRELCADQRVHSTWKKAAQHCLFDVN